MSIFQPIVPVKTRLPLKVWALAAVITMFSLASSLLDRFEPPANSIYASAGITHGFGDRNEDKSAELVTGTLQKR